jgi:hypothetical protein
LLTPGGWVLVVFGPEAVFFFWQKFAKSQPEKYDFDISKGFFMEKMAQILQIVENKIQIVKKFMITSTR